MTRLISVGDVEAAVERARQMHASGHRYFRLTPPSGDGTSFDARRWQARCLLKQLRAVRAAVGDELELMVDLHTRLSPAEAAWFCVEAQPLNLFVVEDPIRSEYPDGYRSAAQQANLRSVSRGRTMGQ